MSARRSRRLGYTMVEVMVALAILAVGATGVIALQKATLISNAQARNIATANAIAKSWAERLRTDALQWNNPSGNPNNELLDLASDADWLSALGNPLYPERVIPAALPDLGAPNADVIGTDIYQVDPSDPDYVEPAFCTHLRFRQFNDPINAGQILWPRLIRVEIRVLWERSGQPINCTAVPGDVDQLPDRYGAVYLVTSVLQNTSPS